MAFTWLLSQEGLIPRPLGKRSWASALSWKLLYQLREQQIHTSTLVQNTWRWITKTNHQEVVGGGEKTYPIDSCKGEACLHMVLYTLSSFNVDIIVKIDSLLHVACNKEGGIEVDGMGSLCEKHGIILQHGGYYMLAPSLENLVYSSTYY